MSLFLSGCCLKTIAATVLGHTQPTGLAVSSLVGSVTGMLIPGHATATQPLPETGIEDFGKILHIIFENAES